MALFLDLAPSVEARLMTLAYARDLSVSEFVRMLFERLEEWEAEREQKPEDMTPEQILNAGIVEMKERQVKNRELTVQVLTHKNNLQAECDREDHIIDECRSKAEKAFESGNRGLAQQFFEEMRLHERIKPVLQERLAAASEATEKVKTAIRAEEERIRRRTAEAQALIASLKQAQIENDIRLSLGLFGSNGDTGEEHEKEDAQAFEEWTHTMSPRTKSPRQTRIPETCNGSLYRA